MMGWSASIRRISGMYGSSSPASNRHSLIVHQTRSRGSPLSLYVPSGSSVRYPAIRERDEGDHVREPLTRGGGIHEVDAWTWDLTRYRPLRPFVSPDTRSLLVKLDALLGPHEQQPYLPVSLEALPEHSIT
jgi:hypothetical protein